MEKEIKDILRKAEETLQAARFGYEDLCASDRKRRFSGLKNLIVFGRSVTFVLQNLKTLVGEKAFDSWYQPIQDKMRSDVLMKYFVTLRNEILKEGKNPSISTAINLTFSSSDLTNLGPPPPGASKFFIGDHTGGSGWIVELPNGTKEKYYVELPESIGRVDQLFRELPVPENDNLKFKSIEDLCRIYLEKIDIILNDAREVFLKK